MAQNRRVDEHEAVHAAGKMRSQPLARHIRVAQPRHDATSARSISRSGLAPLGQMRSGLRRQDQTPSRQSGMSGNQPLNGVGGVAGHAAVDLDRG